MFIAGLRAISIRAAVIAEAYESTFNYAMYIYVTVEHSFIGFFLGFICFMSFVLRKESGSQKPACIFVLPQQWDCVTDCFPGFRGNVHSILHC